MGIKYLVAHFVPLVGIKYLRLHCVALLLIQLEFNLIAIAPCLPTIQLDRFAPCSARIQFDTPVGIKYLRLHCVPLWVSSILWLTSYPCGYQISSASLRRFAPYSARIQLDRYSQFSLNFFIFHYVTAFFRGSITPNSQPSPHERYAETYLRVGFL